MLVPTVIFIWHYVSLLSFGGREGGYRLDPRLLKFLESGGQFVRSPHSIEEVKPLQMIGTLFETSESRTSLYEYGEHTSPTGEL